VEVNFKVSTDLLGNTVVSSLHLDFPEGVEIPMGGISAIGLRKISINNLLAMWFKESSNLYLNTQERDTLIKFLKRGFPHGGRKGLPKHYYAGLSYLYIEYSEKNPRNPTFMLAKSLDTPVKTVLSRLSRARKFGILTPSPKVSAGRASGKMTEQGKKLINEITEEIFI
jgi:hypothetical protein